jgi:hypothetical protein
VVEPKGTRRYNPPGIVKIRGVYRRTTFCVPIMWDAEGNRWIAAHTTHVLKNPDLSVEGAVPLPRHPRNHLASAGKERADEPG